MLYFATFVTMLREFQLLRLYGTYVLCIYVLYARIFRNNRSAAWGSLGFDLINFILEGGGRGNDNTMCHHTTFNELCHCMVYISISSTHCYNQHSNLSFYEFVGSGINEHWFSNKLLKNLPFLAGNKE